MRSFLIFLCALCAGLACHAGSRTAGPATREAPSVPIEAKNPWTHLDFQNDPEAFTFAVVSDLTGGYRPTVFEAAVQRLQWLRPEFVVSVGDLIEGYTEDRAEIERQWDAFDAMLAPLSAPFFYLPGNHDYTNEVMARVWTERYGRHYYHFRYRDVLFLGINTEREQIPMAPEAQALMRDIFRLRKSDPARSLELARTVLGANARLPAELGEDQIAYFEQVIRDNADVRHTFLLMHKPIWQGEGNDGLRRIEAALGARPFTAFAGHVHHYRRFEIGGNLHIRLGTTGGTMIAPTEPGSFDHIVLITMTEEGPSIANLLLDGILDSEGRMGPDDRLWRVQRP